MHASTGTSCLIFPLFPHEEEKDPDSAPQAHRERPRHHEALQ